MGWSHHLWHYHLGLVKGLNGFFAYGGYISFCPTSAFFVSPNWIGPSLVFWQDPRTFCDFQGALNLFLRDWGGFPVKFQLGTFSFLGVVTDLGITDHPGFASSVDLSPPSFTINFDEIVCIDVAKPKVWISNLFWCQKWSWCCRQFGIATFSFDGLWSILMSCLCWSCDLYRCRNILLDRDRCLCCEHGLFNLLFCYHDLIWGCRGCEKLRL